MVMPRDTAPWTADDGLLRSRMLLGDAVMARMAEVEVVLFGVGGVGSWCAESLVRTGVRHLTMVDGDSVCPSNINRQLMATTSTVGQPKVDVMRRRLLDIAPGAVVQARCERFDGRSPLADGLAEYDYIIDAIDSLDDKMLLMRRACDTDAFFVSSMGAALKTDPSRIRTAPFDKVTGCPLARALRRRFRREGDWPARPFPCVFSDEPGANKLETVPRANGSLMHVTASFGLRIAALVVQDIMAAAG